LHFFCAFCFVRLFSGLKRQAPLQLTKGRFMQLLDGSADMESRALHRIADLERLSVDAKRSSEVARMELCRLQRLAELRRINEAITLAQKANRFQELPVLGKDAADLASVIQKEFGCDCLRESWMENLDFLLTTQLAATQAAAQAAEAAADDVLVPKKLHAAILSKYFEEGLCQYAVDPFIFLGSVRPAEGQAASREVAHKLRNELLKQVHSDKRTADETNASCHSAAVDFITFICLDLGSNPPFLFRSLDTLAAWNKNETKCNSRRCMDSEPRAAGALGRHARLASRAREDEERREAEADRLPRGARRRALRRVAGKSLS